MIFHETGLAGCFLIEAEPLSDVRGSFARTFDAGEFARRHLNPSVAQCSVSYNLTAGTLRGLHFQVAPHQEAKLVRCIRGRVYDVVVDMRPGVTHLQWRAFELSDSNHSAIYVPEGLAHGFLTLTDDATLAYQMSVPYRPEAASGLRWDDPILNIRWPRLVLSLSAVDANWPLLVGSGGSSV